MAPADRTRIHRLPHKQVDDPAAISKILARAIVAHVGISVDGQPFVIPLACAPFNGELLLHGSAASRLMTELAKGGPACVTITLLDGLVLARTAFDSSMHYQSLVALGSARLLQGDEVQPALQALTDHLAPNRRAELRQSTQKEIKATHILAFPLTEVSVKISEGQPDDGDEELNTNLWTGVVPIISTYGQPIAAANLNAGINAPAYIKDWPVR